jgi:hypothetical protein
MNGLSRALVQNGIWGVVALGLLASPDRTAVVYPNRNNEYAGFFYTLGTEDVNARLLGAQMVGMLFIIGWVVGIMLPYFVWLDWNGWFRADPLEEIVGLDTSYHGGLALLGDSEVNPEYISAYKKRQEERKSLGRMSATARSLTGGTAFTEEAQSNGHRDNFDDEDDDAESEDPNAPS